MAILPVPTVPDPTPDDLDRIRHNILQAIAPTPPCPPAVRARLIRDDRLSRGNAIEYLDQRQLQRAEFVRYLVQAGVFTDDIESAA